MIRGKYPFPAAAPSALGLEGLPCGTDTGEKHRVRHGARSLASCLPSCAESTWLCCIKCAKVKLKRISQKKKKKRISQINCGDRKR